MTLLSRRKRRTTVRRITPATLAAKLVAFAALVATPALAQPPASYQPPNYQQPGGQSGYQQPTGQPANNLPLPPGYRPRTPPPQTQSQRPTAATGAMAGSDSGGKVMYFQKPADALTATGDADSSAGAVARLNNPNRVVPDAPALTLPPPPPPPPSRYLPAPGGAADRPLTPAVAAAPVYSTQPEIQPKPGDPPPSTSKKQEVKIVPVPPQYIQIPPRERIFMVYNDAQLEKAIMDRLREDLLEQHIRQIEAENKRKPTPEEQKKYLEGQEKYLAFPPLPVISPPGVAYQPKTTTYEPRKLIVEPGYYVHRRLHFEEKNSERIGWDLGPLSTLVSAAYFWKDTLLLPQSLASGCVYGFWDTSAGKCLPGSPSPYYLYPPGLTVSGTVVEGALITGGFFVFP